MEMSSIDLGTLLVVTLGAGSLALLRRMQRQRKVSDSSAPQSTLLEDILSVKTWFGNLLGPTLRGRPACKPTMPGVIPTVIEELQQVMDGRLNWTFVDLGCGQGTMLQPMANATVDGRPMFERVIGVELDPATHAEAARAHNDPKIEVVLGDMFPFVEQACAGKQLYTGAAAFYIYEPLWMANLSTEEMNRLYGGLLDAVAKHPGSIVVYCSADAFREMSTSLLEERGLLLKRAVKVAQNGAFNKLRGVYNPLELWQVPPHVYPPPTPTTVWDTRDFTAGSR